MKHSKRGVTVHEFIRLSTTVHEFFGLPKTVHKIIYIHNCNIYTQYDF